MAHILIVDDASSIRHLVSFTLRTAGHTLLQACTGAEGLQQAREHAVDLILSDVNMPDMDGIAMTRAVRALEHHRFTPILLLTTEAGADKKAEGKAAGATGWLVKPFNPDTLLSTIQKVLG